MTITPKLRLWLPIVFGLATLVPASAHAQGTKPAGGAALGEVLLATGMAAVVTAVLLVLAMGHRSGKVGALGWAAARAERISGYPGWAALPAGIATVSLLVALFGMYWDISLHIGVGRDEGPLANAAHYYILIGLFGIFAAGVVAMALPRGRPSATAIRLSRDWHAPLGGVLICACGAFSLLGFPLDDVWHRLFGQDVTLWGPTHLMLIGGAAMTLVGLAVLLVEGQRAGGRSAEEAPETGFAATLRRVALPGGFLLGLATFQAEFDFGVPQFRFVFQPILIALAAGVGLVATRMWLGRGSALGAVAFFIAIRGLLAVLVGPVLGEATPHFPLLIVEAVLVELVALRYTRQQPIRFGVVCGVLIGTVGLAAEWAWSHVWMPLPWPLELLPEAAVLGFVAAVAGSLVGAWIGARLSAEAVPRTRSLRAAGALGAVAIAAIVGFTLYKPADPGVSARVQLRDVASGPARTVEATFTMAPQGADEGAEWLQVTAWQGGGLIVDRLDRIGPETYRTTQAIPVHGSWKALLRLHRGDSLTVVPLFMPLDTAIPAPEVPALPAFERSFVPDHLVLQREKRPGAPLVTAIAYAVVIGIALGLLVLLSWGLHRLALAAPGQGPDRPKPEPARPRASREPAAAAG